jgi:hypothetical protein
MLRPLIAAVGTGLSMVGLAMSPAEPLSVKQHEVPPPAGLYYALGRSAVRVSPEIPGDDGALLFAGGLVLASTGLMLPSKHRE